MFQIGDHVIVRGCAQNAIVVKPERKPYSIEYQYLIEFADGLRSFYNEADLLLIRLITRETFERLAPAYTPLSLQDSFAKQLEAKDLAIACLREEVRALEIRHADLEERVEGSDYALNLVCDALTDAGVYESEDDTDIEEEELVDAIQQLVEQRDDACSEFDHVSRLLDQASVETYAYDSQLTTIQRLKRLIDARDQAVIKLRGREQAIETIAIELAAARALVKPKPGDTVEIDLVAAFGSTPPLWARTGSRVVVDRIQEGRGADEGRQYLTPPGQYGAWVKCHVVKVS